MPHRALSGSRPHDVDDGPTARDERLRNGACGLAALLRRVEERPRRQSRDRATTLERPDAYHGAPADRSGGYRAERARVGRCVRRVAAKRHRATSDRGHALDELAAPIPWIGGQNDIAHARRAARTDDEEAVSGRQGWLHGATPDDHDIGTPKGHDDRRQGEEPAKKGKQGS